MTFFYTDFCTKMKFLLLFMIFWGTGGCQDNFVRFFSLLALQTRGASVMSWLFQSIPKECVKNSWVFEGSDWDLPQLSSQTRVKSTESFLFQSVCMVWLGPASRRRSWMTTTVPSKAAEIDDEVGGGVWGILKLHYESASLQSMWWMNKQA